VAHHAGLLEEDLEEITDPHEDHEAESTDLHEDPPEETTALRTMIILLLEATLSTLGGRPLPSKMIMNMDPCVEALQARGLPLMVVRICEEGLLLQEVVVVVVLKLLPRLEGPSTVDAMNMILTWRAIIMVARLRPILLEEVQGLVGPDQIL